ncbi:Peptidase, M50 family protein [Magnetospirillum sp. LM-5]|nr:Peptidase, M50 family protein [Magnetospirillum sp. LM-5]
MMTDMVMLPPLREELSLHSGPAAHDGSPTWTIRDPVRNRFYRIGWPAFEMLSRWHLGDARAVAQDLRDHTTLQVDIEDVGQMAQFLAGHLLTRPMGPRDTARLIERAAAQKHSWWNWLLHHYLFFRIPLVRPDRWLGASVHHVRWLGGRGFMVATALALLAGLVLVGRRWDEFAATLVDTFSPSGLAAYGLALTVVKVAHELAHAYTARHYGCRVPTMGLAFLVMWPVLYTDVNEAWMLASRRQRLRVGAAGIMAELAIAAWATLAWAFLPDGPARQAAFVLAALSWVSSLIINLSPFMRFDGYFLLMDGLELPNLHPRSFAMARWWLREVLFDLGEPAPEPMAPAQRAAMIAFAVLVWIYRLTLFLGIAVLVYHFFIKAVGIMLFAVEIGWFVLMPLVSEIREWIKRRPLIEKRQRWRLTGGLLAALLVALALPWPTRIEAPAIVRAHPVTILYLPGPARLAERQVGPGQMVRAGQMIYRFDSPDLERRLAIVDARLAGRQGELETARLDMAYRERLSVLTEDIARLQAEHAALVAERERLNITAPHDGRLLDLPPALDVGDWVSVHLPLGLVQGHAGAVAIAYVAEHDLGRIGAGAAVTVVPTSLDHDRLSGTVATIEPAPVKLLADTSLASQQGGPIATFASQAGPIPESPWTRVTITLDQAPPAHELPATALIEAEPASPLGRLARSVLIILVREWGA